MSIFTWRSVKKDFGIKEILKGASFSLEDADKVGVIGTNGSGKSTVLKMLAGLEPIDSGEVQINPNARVVYLPQQPDVDEDHTVLEQVFADAGEQMALVREYEDLSHRMAKAHPDDMTRLMTQLSAVTEKMDAMAAWDVETNAKIVLSQLGIDDFGARVGDLSGGYRKRVALAAALLADPDVLLMDEPTNHLDAESVEWLQHYLGQFRGTLLLITHDRYFLDRVTNRIIELDRGDLYTYSGNYSYYLEKKVAQEDSALSSQKKHAGILRRELEWLKQGPKARSTKQRARIDRIEDLKNKEFKQAQGKVEISTPGRRIGKMVIEVNQVSKRYGDRTLIQDFTYEFTPSDRVGIIGGNGAGKTTLMDLITQRLEPDSGSVKIGSTIHIGYFDQHSDDLQAALHDDERVIDYIKEEGEFVETADGSKITASQMLERFLFPGNQQYAPIHKLSGGEKRRLFLLRVLMGAPNVLILDEPTNDLDVQTLSILEEYLENFNGCVITVSHDRYFLDRVVHRIFAFEGDGVVRQYPGNYSMYLEFKSRQLDANREQAPSPSQSKVPSPSPTPSTPSHKPKQTSRPRKLSFKEKRELEQLEAKIPELEAEKAEVERQLYGNPPSDYTQVETLSTQLAQLTLEIDTATERWMELEEIAANS
ncbi:MAG: ABC-F family ATP-binding cassette domain-containing protein [Leptolyngbyaceae bacterium]|nr:ABC-F family ATP-binding cassette domain-containing protein [Leptolyngbyaceae bacterium]